MPLPPTNKLGQRQVGRGLPADTAIPGADSRGHEHGTRPA
jgi:hypothetical protein